MVYKRVSTSNVQVFPLDFQNMNQVIDKLLGVFSVFLKEGEDTLDAFRKVGPKDDWTTRRPERTKRICSDPKNCKITMYESVFRHLGFHFSFRTFEIKILDHIHLQLASSQLHMNCWDYIMYQYLKLAPCDPFFFNIFELLWHKENPKLKQGHVSFKQKLKCFMAFTHSLKGFKRRYYYIVARLEEAHKNRCVISPIYDLNS